MMSSWRGRASILFVLAAAAVLAGEPGHEAPTSAIRLDQAGYPPTAPKIAAVVAQQTASEFLVRRAGDGSVVYRGVLNRPAFDPDSGDRVQAAVFTALETEGRYFLDVPGVGRSWTFAIAQDVYTRAYYLTARAFYGMRCGTAVDLGPGFPGYRHPACHLEGAYHASSGKTGPKHNPGGWHDAGDYGRYMVNSGISTGTLLWTWELFGDKVREVSLRLPESGNGTPDLLNEIRWNLDWMLSMQDHDGGAWHKQTSERFPDFIAPDADRSVSFVIGTAKEPYKTSCATGDLAAVAAIAARAYQPFDARFAERCLRASRRAWIWLGRHPNVTFRNPPGVSTGEYGDADCSDERLWAAAELWRTTKEPAYERYFLDHFAENLPALHQPRPEGWANVAPMALWTYLLGGGANAPVAATIRAAVLEVADATVARTQRHPYRQSLSTADYVWGSNGVAADYGVALLIANIIRPDPRYVEAALNNLHYLLGCNPFSLSWVTQLGENSVRHPHHRPSGAQPGREPWPGLLAGGPNRNRQDPVLQALPDLPPAKLYADDVASYSSNEVAINWNASLVFLLAGVMGR